MRKSVLGVICLAVLAVLVSCFVVTPTQASAESQSIVNATSAINQAFNNVLTAEQLGANVTVLLSKLNTAGQLLSQAKNYYSSGSMSDVTEKAQSAQSIADQVNNQALALQITASNQSKSNFYQTAAVSVIGAVVFVLILLLIWRRVKSSYFKKLLDSKIEGVADGT
jgi:hypothetical protein